MKTRSRDVTPIQRTAFSAPNCRRSSNDISSTSWLEAALLILLDIDILLNRTIIDDNGWVWVIPVRLLERLGDPYSTTSISINGYYKLIVTGRCIDYHEISHYKSV